MKVEKVELPALRVLAFRRVGPYGPGVGEAFCKLTSFACKNGLFCGSSIVIGSYLDCPKTTPPEQCRMDACLTLEPQMAPALENGFRIETLPGGLCAEYLCNVHDNDFAAPHNELAGWLPQNGLSWDGGRPCYEFYYGPCAQTHPLKKWVIDILYPVK